MSDYLDPNNEELLRDFFEEAQLQVDIMEQNILVLENDSSDRDSVDELFRAAHTLKGAAATVQMNELAEFTHIVEDVLDEVRDDKIKVAESVVDIILTSIDVVKLMLEARLEGLVYDDGDDVNAAIEILTHLRDGEVETLIPESLESKEDISGEDSSTTLSSSIQDSISEFEVYELFENAGKGNPVYRIRVDFDKDALMNTVGGIQIYSILKNCGIILKTNPDFEALNDDVYHPFIFYYLTTDESLEEIKARVNIIDVTTGSEVIQIVEQMIDEIVSNSEDSLSNRNAMIDQGSQEVVDDTVDSDPLEESIAESVPEVLVADIEPERADYENLVEVPQPSGNNASIKQRKPLQKKELSSILRVDSRKIDNLLNMVSEAVINKSTINRITMEMADIHSEFQTITSAMEFEIRSIIDFIPKLARQIVEGRDTREAVDAYKEQFANSVLPYSDFDSRLKKSVTNLKNASQKLSINTGNLQEGIMKIRMVPISNIFSRFPRLVRDLSHSLDKSINLVLQGEDTELDKSVIEDLLDPLIHCVRNSIDHGIESPNERIRSEKSEQGTITLKASNEGSMILIEVIDDGKGIDPQKILNKAVEKGLITSEASMSENEIYSLLFEPGFTTAEKVTNVSGRGVGMDVVKTQIEKLKGSILVSSEPGKGTRISIRLPLTLAIIQGLLVQVGEEVYSIPVTSVVDSHRIGAEDIRMVDSYEVFNVRNEVVFLTRLNKLFQIPGESAVGHKYVVIVGSAEKKMGLIVDALIGEEDVVIKPLKDEFSNTLGIAGATILGDGKVSLIIDVTQLLELGAIKQIESRHQTDVLLES